VAPAGRVGHRGRVLPVPPGDLAALRPWFAPERPGPLVFEHLLSTGVGSCAVDRRREPRVVLAEIGDNYALRGDPDAASPEHLAGIRGFVDAGPQWRPALERSASRVLAWDRVIGVLPGSAALPAPRPEVRRLTAADADRLTALPGDLAWIHDSWGGVGGVLAAEVAHGAVVDGAIASVAVPFYSGRTYEDIGVVTAEGHRRRGLSAACAAAVVADVRARGRIPTWTTSPDNAGSLAVAQRLGFVHERDDVLWAVRTAVPG
jgi:RimJ/RimL family protein N-acetyltransferase